MSCGCEHRRSNQSWLIIAAVAILAGILLFFLLTTGVAAFANVFNTTTTTVAAGAAVPFTATGPLRNITFTAPSTLTVGPTAGGTYQITYNLNLTSVAAASDTFALTVNGVVQPSTAAGITLAAGQTAPLSMSSTIPIPAGATVQLINTGAATITISSTVGTVTVPSAELNLNRIGP